VRGDAQSGATVKHRSRVARDPTTPDLRQVHLVHRELFDELAGTGFTVGAAAQRSIIGPDASTSRSSSTASTISWSPYVPSDSAAHTAP